MITVHLMGGLGNQLFQIFATIAYSLNNRIPFLLPQYKKTNEAPYRQITYWNNFDSENNEHSFDSISFESITISPDSKKMPTYCKLSCISFVM